MGHFAIQSGNGPFQATVEAHQVGQRPLEPHGLLRGWFEDIFGQLLELVCRILRLLDAAAAQPRPGPGVGDD